MFVGSVVYVVTKDNIIEGTLDRITLKRAHLGVQQFPFQNVYTSRNDAETRFVRDGMKMLRESNTNWKRLFTMLEDLKDSKPALFV